MAIFSSRFRLSGLLLLGVGLVFSSLAGFAALPLQSGDNDYALGVRAYRAGNYELAERYFFHTLARNPSSVNAHYYRALALDNLGRPGSALPEYRYVASHGREARIVSYARERASATAALSGSMSIRPSGGTDMAMMASGSSGGAVAERVANYPMTVPLKSNRNALMLDAVLRHGSRQAQGNFIVDTGATYTSISLELAEQLGLDLEQGEHVRITTANGRIEVPKVVIGTLNVNGLEAHNVEATVIPVRTGSTFSGLLGLSFLRQFVVTIDPQAGQLIFDKHN